MPCFLEFLCIFYFIYFWSHLLTYEIIFGWFKIHFTNYLSGKIFYFTFSLIFHEIFLKQIHCQVIFPLLIFYAFWQFFLSFIFYFFKYRKLIEIRPSHSSEASELKFNGLNEILSSSLSLIHSLFLSIFVMREKHKQNFQWLMPKKEY